MKETIDRARLESRMTEYLANWQASKKPKSTKGRVKYDWGAKRRLAAEKAAHRHCTVATPAFRENYDFIFGRNAK